MRAVEITRHGGPEVLQVRERPSPTLTPGSVRIRVRAAGVNFADLQMRMGMYPEAPKPPFAPGYEIAGEVVEAAPGVTSLAAGDRVLAGCHFGGYVDEIVLPAEWVRRIPGALSFEEAATIPVNWMTAWTAAVEMARVRAGDRVLVQSAAGGVGVAAVQIAARAGAHVIGLVGSAAKRDTVLSLGAKEVWLNDDWLRRDSERFDLILESTGGAELKRSFSRLHPTGRVVTFGVSSMVSGRTRSILTVVKTLANMPLFTPFKLMMTNRGVFGVNMLKLFERDMPRLTGPLEKALEGFAAGHYRAIVGKSFPFAEAGAAHEHLRSRSNIGKVVLTP